MSEVEAYNRSPMDEAFDASKLCDEPEGCKMSKIGLAIWSLGVNERIIQGLDNGPFDPYEFPKGPCPNQDQLFCQSRIHDSE